MSVLALGILSFTLMVLGAVPPPAPAHGEPAAAMQKTVLETVREEYNKSLQELNEKIDARKNKIINSQLTDAQKKNELQTLAAAQQKEANSLEGYYRKKFADDMQHEKMLFEHEQKDPVAAFMSYAVTPDFKRMKTLLARIDSPQKRTELVNSRTPQHQFTVLHMMFLENPAQDVAWQQRAIAKLVVDAGLSVNSTDAYGRTPLHYAAFKRHLSDARELLELGAQVDSVDREGATPLYMLAQREIPGAQDVQAQHLFAKALLAKGASLDKALLFAAGNLKSSAANTTKEDQEARERALTFLTRLAGEQKAETERVIELKMKQKAAAAGAVRQDNQNFWIAVQGEHFVIPVASKVAGVFGILENRESVSLREDISLDAMRKFFYLVRPQFGLPAGYIVSFLEAKNSDTKMIFQKEILSYLRGAIAYGKEKEFLHTAKLLQSDVLENFVTQIVNERRGRERDRSRERGARDLD